VNVLVDLDGTLTDSAPGIISCVRHALTEMGRECPDDAALRHFIGPPLHETFRKILGSDDPAEVDPVIERYRRHFSERGLYENAVYSGIPAALEVLKASGAVLFVATSKPLPYAERIIRHFGLDKYFGAVYGSGFDGTLSKKPELIAHILKTESLTPQATCMVGDRSQDIVGAKANGVFPIGVLWGYGSHEELTTAGAAVLCERPEQLYSAAQSF
jgi:phosphoglycolate phosphatase